MELIAPAEFETRLRQSVVADSSTGVSFSQIGSVGGNLIGDDTRAYIFLIRQRQVLLGCYVAQHSRAEPGNLRTTDGTGNMVVAGCNIGYYRAQRVERRLVALNQLAFHILMYLVHRYMAGALDKCLHAFVPSTQHQLAHRVELGKLGCIVGIGRTARAQSVAKTQSYIVARHNVADVIKMVVEETLLIVYQTPLAHNAAAATHNAAQSAIGQVHVVATDAGMDGKIVNTLLALLNQRVAINLPRQILYLAVHLLQSLIDGHGAYGYRTVAQNPLAGFVNVVAG